jgi:hypothetical protein
MVGADAPPYLYIQPAEARAAALAEGTAAALGRGMINEACISIQPM